MPEINFNNFYTKDINQLTLKEALDLHYKLNPQFTPWYKYDTAEASMLIKAHDISHIIFGCNTSYGGEYCVQTWVKYGAKLNVPLLRLPKFLFNKDLIQIILPPKLISYSLTHFTDFMRFKKLIRNQTKLMTKKWIYFEEEKYLNKTVGEIRAEYGIQLLTLN